MALTRSALAALLALVAFGIAPTAFAAPPHATSQIVVYKGGVSNAPAQTLKRERDLGFSASQRYRRAIEGFAAELTPGQIDKLQDDPDVARVVPDRPVSIDSVPLVAGGTVPVGLERIHAIQGSSIREASGAAVAVIDTGVDLANPDLNVAAGTNCTGNGPPNDDHGHGTHVAGTIGALNDGSGVVGVAPGTKIYAVKVLGADGSGSTSQVICGVDWVAQHAATLGIKVANMSLGGAGSVGTCASDPEHQAICNAVAAGVTMVVAAGNDSAPIGGGAGGAHVPGAYPEALTVSAMSDTDGVAGGLGVACSNSPDDVAASFSNYGVTAADSAHMIAAPGACVVSLGNGGGLRTMSGTSMATPHVTAAAALCINEAGSDGPCAGLSPAGVIQVLRQTAADGATVANGFNGDPLHAGPHYYGYLVRASMPPRPVTGDASVLGDTDADLAGTVDNTGAAADWWFELEGGDATITTATQSGSPGPGAVPIQLSATGLDPGTTYSYRLVVSADGWTVRGAAKTFLTSGVPPPPPPDTQIDAGPAALTASASAQVAFSAAAGPPAGSFECALDGAPWAACSSPLSLSNLSEGQHTFVVRGVSAGGKKDLSPASVTWTVDLTPPNTRIGGSPADPTTNRDATFGISADETGVTFACRLDSETWTPCGAIATRTGLAPGRHHFEARATDAAGLTDPTAAVYDWTIVGPAAPSAPAPTTPAAADTSLVSVPPVQSLPLTAVLAPLGSVRVDRSRARATVTLLCRGPARCSGRLELRASGRTVGSALVRLAAGKRQVVTITIPRRARSAMRVRTVTLRLAGITLSGTQLQKRRLRLLTGSVKPV